MVLASGKLPLLFAVLLSCLLIAARARDQDRAKDVMKDWYKGLKPSKVVYAVNCGGDSDLTDDAGIVFKADQGFTGGQTTSGCGMHRWFMPNSEIYHAERWGEQFSYFVPLSDKSDSQHTLVLKFSECYFWEPGMKVFDVTIGDLTILKDMDPFSSAGQKLLPGDEFIDLQVRDGKLYADGRLANNAFTKAGKIEVVFRKGKADNPKINGLLLVKGGIENTHHSTYRGYKEAMMALQVEKQEAREKAEQFFAEDAYDFEERVDGRGPFN